MPALKCPNPSCPFLFDPSLVPPGAVLTCPRCAMRFTLGSGPPEAPPAGTIAEPPADAPAPPATSPSRPSPKRGDGFGRTVLALAGVTLVVVFTVAAVVLAV